jgi:galactokinase
MYASHESCANDYEISTTELDTLVSMAQQAGAVGARLTGAGFGGCVIGLVRDSEVDTFITTVENDYYGDYLGMNKSHRTEGDKLADHLFACTAVRGAGTLFA